MKCGNGSLQKGMRLLLGIAASVLDVVLLCVLQWLPGWWTKAVWAC